LGEEDLLMLKSRLAKTVEFIARFTCILLNILFFVGVSGCSSTETSGPSLKKREPSSEVELELRDHPPVDPMKDLGSYTVSRKISMFYRLDLKKDNFWAPSLAATFKSHEGQMRACYMERLNIQPALKGAISLSFRLDRGESTARDLKRVGGNITDNVLVDCLRKRVMEIPLNPPRRMRGLITWEFGVIEGVAKK